MNTNVAIPAGMSNLPVALMCNTEFFTKNGHVMAIHNGKTMDFFNLPEEIQQAAFKLYEQDVNGKKMLRKMGYIGMAKAFPKWLACKFGSLDGVTDFENGKLQPDFFNASCTSTTCPFRGKLCGTQSAITREDYNTLSLVVQGFSAKLIADRLNLTHAGVKSRLEVLKLRFNAVNLPSLAAKATLLGIQPASANAQK